MYDALQALICILKTDDDMEENNTMQNINIPGRLMKDIRTFARENNVEKIILFGSRARGTHYERSDVDLAVKGGNYYAFVADIQEKAFSLLSFNIVKYDDRMTWELKEELRRDGLVIFEKKDWSSVPYYSCEN